MFFNRILLCAILAAIKYNEDDYYSNVFYSKVGGITLSEINDLELAFLSGIDYSLYISNKEFISYIGLLKELIRGDDEHDNYNNDDENSLISF